MTMMRSSGRSFLMRGIRSSPFSSGITTSVMTRSPSPSDTQRHRVAALLGGAHVVAEPAQRLAQHRADGSVVVGDEDGRGVLMPALPAAAFRRARRPADARGTPCGAAGCRTRSRRHGRRSPWRRARDRGPLPLCLVVTNGSNRCGRRSSGMPSPLSVTETTSGRCTRLSLPATASRTPCWIGGREHDLAALRRRRLGGVLDEVEESLDQQVAIAVHRRQRGVVLLDEAHMAGKARLRGAAHALEHLVDVDRRALDRPPIGEHLHAVDQRADAIGLVADQPRQLAIRRRRRSPREAAPRRGCPRAGSSPHAPASPPSPSPSARRCGASAGGRSSSAIERSCSVTTTWPSSSPSGAAWIVSDTRAEARRVERRRHIRRRCAPVRRTESMSAKTRAVGRQEFDQRQAEQHGRAGVEELLGRGVGVAQAVRAIDHEHRIGQRREHGARLDRHAGGRRRITLPRAGIASGRLCDERRVEIADHRLHRRRVRRCG